MLVDHVAGHTTLTGAVAKSKFGTGRAYLGYTIYGLGNFGEVKVKMYAPPFLVDRYPFSPGAAITQVSNGSVVRLDGQVVKTGRPVRNHPQLVPTTRRPLPTRVPAAPKTARHVATVPRTIAARAALPRPFLAFHH